MIFLRAIRPLLVATLFSCIPVYAQSTAGIEQKLDSEYPLTKTTADRTDIVTAGAVLVLQKDGLLMIATTSTRPTDNTYKDGRISQNVWKMARVGGLNGLTHPMGSAPEKTRRFVAGEKFWVTGIHLVDDGVVMDLFTDPISEVRYYSTIKFPYTKGTPPPDAQIDSEVAEVFKIAPDDNNNTAGAAPKGRAPGAAPAGNSFAQAPASAPTPAAPMAPIAPPPPPPDAAQAAPKTIALKQTKDEVVANFGPPTKVVKLGTKEIDYYPDMKVTFVNDKVTDIQ